MKLAQLTGRLDDLLQLDKIQDFPNAFNGLQLENSGEVTRVAAAVDACEAVIREAITAEADLLIVHHGMLWMGAGPVTGAFHRKLRLAMEGGLAVYSAHLPLDQHPELGNNALLASAIGLENPKPFLPTLNADLGLKASTDRTLDDLRAAVETAVGEPVHVAPGGTRQAGVVGVVTGGGGGEIHRVAQAGIDTFVTGEGPHWSYTAAEELGVNLIYAGHYATETFGVKALAHWIEKEFGLPWNFIDHPTGL